MTGGDENLISLNSAAPFQLKSLLIGRLFPWELSADSEAVERSYSPTNTTHIEAANLWSSDLFRVGLNSSDCSAWVLGCVCRALRLQHTSTPQRPLTRSRAQRTAHPA